jgi:AcrR family transcriptional regulator
MESGKSERKCRWQRRADSRPEEILLAALDVLTEKGYRSARLEDVAAKAGVTKPLIYHYFQGKDDLVRKALEWRLRQVLQGMREELAELGGAWDERLRQFCRWQWEKWISPEWGAFIQGVVVELRQEVPDLHRQWIQLAYLGRCAVAEEILVEAGDALRPGVDPAAASRFLLGGLWHTALMNGSDVERYSDRPGLVGLMENHLDIFLAGVRRNGAEGK